MAKATGWGAPLRHFQELFGRGSAVGVTDGQLLERYVATGDDDAFEALVFRHGPMIEATCRTVLRDEHDAEDAFQATFLILARKARSLRADAALGGWLHRIAYRAAVQISVQARRRRREETEAGLMTVRGRTGTRGVEEASHLVHEEVNRLPERLRLPVVLHDLQGLSYAEAASRLGLTEPALRTRLARGRERLRSAMIRRGLSPAIRGLIPAIPARQVSAVWARNALRLATAWKTEAGPASVAMVSTAAGLSREVLKIMFIRKLLVAGGLVLIAVTSVAGVRGWPSIRASMRYNREIQAGTKEMIIRGRVDGPDGNPLANAELSSPLLKIQGGRVKTNQEGGFAMTVEEPPLGEFAIRADAPGLPTKVFTIRTSQDPPSTPTVALAGINRPVHHLSPAGAIDRALNMERGSNVVGRIVREGRPVAGSIVGLLRHPSGFDGLLGPEEVKADADGRFRFLHAPADADCWLYVPIGSLDQAGAFRPKHLQTSAPGDTIDLGDLEVKPGRTLSGRVVLSDGKPLPSNTQVLASVDHAGGLLRTKIDSSGRFTLDGLPDGQIEISAYFPDAQFYAPAGYRASPKNACLDPLNPWRLVGRLDGDRDDLTILFEPGETPAPVMKREVLDAFKQIQAGPITGVPPVRLE